MNIAFYAPLKPPNHPVPSGDRRMARQLIKALSLTSATVSVASTFRSWEGHGDKERQNRLEHVGDQIFRRLMRRYRARHLVVPDLWFTYHLYHKSPDWLGPRISQEFGIPYVVAEASFAPKQSTGKWARWHTVVGQSLAAASSIVHLNPVDVACVEACMSEDVNRLQLLPFLDDFPRILSAKKVRAVYAGQYGLDRSRPWLLTVAMMRYDSKLSSYRQLAAVLSTLKHVDWELLIAGDGAARGVVEDFFADLSDRVHFLGNISSAELDRAYSASDLFVWPAINEAYSMAILEAQAAGLPAVVGDQGGVSTIVVDGETGLLVDPFDVPAFSSALLRLLNAVDQRKAMGERAVAKIRKYHSLAEASKQLRRALWT